ncbi:MAG: universal stress protein [Armatimonadetes bacterium]|nr:universal stress protein [Armatimonadota bacterium]
MKVLLATDDSDYAQLAEAALRLTPRLRAADVSVASVVPSAHVAVASVAPLGMAVSGEQAREIVEIGLHHAQSFVEAAVGRLRAHGHKAEGVVLEGNIGDRLLEHAESERVDLILVGSRGLGAIKSFVLGSVARKLLNQATCSVLVSHPYAGHSVGDSLKQLQQLEKARVVLGADGSAGAEAAENWLAQEGPGSFDMVCSACAEPLNVVPAGVDPAAFLPYYEYDRDRALSVVQHSQERMAGLGVEMCTHTDIGRPAEVLIETAKTKSADLLVVGATRHGVLERFLIGSVSYEVAVQAPCSVLVVRP